MAFCEFCGSQVPDGQLCNCPGAQQARGQAPAPAPTYPQQGGYPQPGAYPQPGVAQPVQPKAGGKLDDVKNLVGGHVEKFKNGDKNTKIKYCAIAGGIVAALIAAFILIFCVSWGYKGAVKDLQKGIQKADYERIMDACFPDDIVKQRKEEEGKDEFNEKIEEFNEELEEELENKYGEGLKCSIDIRKKTALKKKALSDIEDYLVDQYGTEATVKKGYKLKVRFSLKGSDDHYAETGNLYVVKLGNGGGGWKVVAGYGEDHIRIERLLDT